jgi:hypothetical protein
MGKKNYQHENSTEIKTQIRIDIPGLFNIGGGED